MRWLDEYGELELDAVIEPAITLAREGYPVSPEMADWLETEATLLDGRSDTADIYLSDGELLEEGETVYQEEMAETFESLIVAYDDARDDGRSDAVQAARDYFYRGPIAEAIVAFSDEHDGYLTLSDFHEFEAELVEPISIEYGGETQVYQNPPNSQGIRNCWR